MPRMKPIEPWHTLYKQVNAALRNKGKRERPNMTLEELKQANIARNALWMLAHNREHNEGAVEALRGVLDKKRS